MNQAHHKQEVLCVIKSVFRYLSIESGKSSADIWSLIRSVRAFNMKIIHKIVSNFMHKLLPVCTTQSAETSAVSLPHSARASGFIWRQEINRRRV